MSILLSHLEKASGVPTLVSFLRLFRAKKAATGILIIFASLTVPLASCGTTPAQRVILTDTVYTTGMNELIALRQQGKITDAQYLAFTPYVHALNAALKQAEIAAATGQDPDITALTAALNAFIANEPAAPAPTTQP